MKKKNKKRNPIAFDLLTNGLYKLKIFKMKTRYDRKKSKQLIKKEMEENDKR